MGGAVENERIDDIIKKIPDNSSMVFVAWVRDHEGFVQAGSNTAIFEEPLQEGHVDRLCGLIMTSAKTLGIQIVATPGTTMCELVSTAPRQATLLEDLQVLVDGGILTDSEAAPVFEALRNR
jgi:hypothetical protein